MRSRLYLRNTIGSDLLGVTASRLHNMQGLAGRFSGVERDRDRDRDLQLNPWCHIYE